MNAPSQTDIQTMENLRFFLFRRDVIFALCQLF